jgi:hypothetical protein
MSNKYTGGPAFPVRLPIVGAIHKCDEPVPTEIHAGLTLRDYFAAKAMQGWLASSPIISGEPMNGSAEMAEQLAVASFVLADAMLKAREA